jgi:hypothetical protein
MGTLGVRVAVNPWKWMTLQSAVFQGNVFAQDVNRHGFKWDLNPALGYFWINELQVRWNQDSNALPGQAKFGAWFQTADFADLFLTIPACRWLTRIPAGSRKLTLGITDSTGSWTKCSTASPQSRGLSPVSARMENRSLPQRKASQVGKSPAVRVSAGSGESLSSHRIAFCRVLF